MTSLIPAAIAAGYGSSSSLRRPERLTFRVTGQIGFWFLVAAPSTGKRWQLPSDRLLGAAMKFWSNSVRLTMLGIAGEQERWQRSMKLLASGEDVDDRGRG